MHKKQQLLVTHFTNWHGKMKKQKSLEYNEEIAEKIYRHRHLSKYLMNWLKSLHHKLKQDHLEVLMQKFQKYYTRKRFLLRWKTEFERHQYLE